MPVPGGNYPEVLERVLRPTQKGIALPISLELTFHVLPVRLGSAEKIDLHRMIDDQVGWHHWIDPVGITAQRFEPIPHGGQIDDRRNAGEVLKNDARWHERDVRPRVGGAPRGYGLHVIFLHVRSTRMPEGVL